MLGLLSLTAPFSPFRHQRLTRGIRQTIQIKSHHLLYSVQSSRTEQSPKLFGHIYTQLYRTQEVQWKEKGWMDLWTSWAGQVGGSINYQTLWTAN